MGVIVPWVNNRGQAEAAVRAAKYPPVGIRGVGPRWVTVADEDLGGYLRTANDETLVIVQIETVEAVRNLEEILTTPGVDAYLVGPADLSASLGHLGDISHPEVEKVIIDIITRSKKLKVPGCYATASPELCLKRIEQGFQFVTLGNEIGLLRAGVQGLMAKMGRKA
jgi:2-keto-3-deoxy-L-rhamnonate aldolase RhmA